MDRVCAVMVLFASLIIVGSSMIDDSFAQIEPGQDDLPWEPITPEESAALSEKERDRIFDELVDLYTDMLDQNEVVEYHINGSITVTRPTNSTIDALVEHIRIVMPPIPVKEIPLEMQGRIDEAREKLMESDIPWIRILVDPPTGKLHVYLDIERIEPDSEQRVKEITGDLPIILTIKKNTFTLNGESITDDPSAQAG